MKSGSAWLVVAGLAAANVAALAAAPEAVVVLAAASGILMRRGRLGWLYFSVVTIAINVLLLGLLVEGGSTLAVGPLEFGSVGLARGLVGGLRLAAILGVNLAVLSWVRLEALLDGLGLPPGATAFLAAVLIAAHDIARDASRLVTARRLEGKWPTGWLRRVAAGATLLAPLLVLAIRRANHRRDALRLAGHDTNSRFAPVVAITALAIASRMAFIALPNITPTYAVVFLGGLLFGPAVGALAGLASMALTDLMLTGLFIAPFANAPAMALVGASGGLLRSWSGAPRAAIVAAAACFGILTTLAFSVSSDVLTWLVVAEFRNTPGYLTTLLLAGLVFNVVPAVVNAVLFAMSVGPVARAARAAGIVDPPTIRAHSERPRETVS